MTREELVVEIKKLPSHEQHRLADDLNGYLAADVEGLEVSDALRLALDERIAEADAHPEDFISWDEARKRLDLRRLESKK